MFTKKLVVVIACALALTAWCGAAYAELLVNRGFETGDFTNWRSVAPSGTAPTITSTPAEVYEGTYAAVLTKTSASDYLVLDNYTTEATVVPGERLRVSYAVKRLAGDSNSELQVAINVNGTGGTWNVQQNAVNVDSWKITQPGTDWSVVEYETIVPNDAFQYNKLYIAWRMPDSTSVLGTYAIDSVSAIATPVPEPSTLALLATGLLGCVWRRRS